MIAHLSGMILTHTLDRLILDVQGVGYEVFVPIGTQGRLKPREDGRVSVHVHTQVREDAIHLYGFATGDEKIVFERLMTVTGVGAKMALAILSALPPAELFQAVEGNDLKALVGVSGVGKKTAQRLILELKSKFDDMTLDAIAPSAALKGNKLMDDLKSALKNMGYPPATIDAVVEQLAARAAEFDSVEAMIRESFKLLR